jgi:4-hydroxy-tetrahydrodipicolinate synthase
VTTKFTNDDQLDFKMFDVNIQAQIDAGVSGIVLGGTLGEASTLTSFEKSELIKNTILITENKIPVLMNIAEQSTSEAIRSAISAEKDGASGSNDFTTNEIQS